MARRGHTGEGGGVGWEGPALRQEAPAKVDVQGRRGGGGVGWVGRRGPRSALRSRQAAALQSDRAASGRLRLPPAVAGAQPVD